MFVCRRGSVLYSVLVTMTLAAVGVLTTARHVVEPVKPVARSVEPVTPAAHRAAPTVLVAGVSVTPDNGPAVERGEYTTGHTAVFTVQNTGTTTDSYFLGCGGTGSVTCLDVPLSTGAIAAGAQKAITVTYQVGAVGAGQVWLNASKAFTFPPVTDGGSINVTVVRYGVAVTPDGTTTPVRQGNTGPYQAVFTVQNTGTGQNTYTLSCGGTNGVSCSPLPGGTSPVTLNAGASTNITVDYSVGAQSPGTVYLNATGTGAQEQGTYSVPVEYYAVAVTPDGTPVQRNANTTGHTADFTVTNTGATAATFSLACSQTGAVTCGTLPSPSVALNPGAQATVAMPYNVGAAGSGTLTLTATYSSASNAGNYAVTVVAPGQQTPFVVLDSVNPGPLIERDLCLTVRLTAAAAARCGDLELTHALPATRTLNKTRTPVLLYSSQAGHPTPVVGANVTLSSTATVPDSVVMKLWVCPPGGSCLFKTSGNWSGSNWTPGATRRITLSYDAKDDSTNIYRDSLEVTNWYGNTPKVTVTGTQHAVVNRHKSYFGTGWWLAGLEQLRLADMVWVGGDGSVRQYTSVATNVWVAPGIDRPDTLKKVGTEYIRYLPAKGEVVFDATGKHVRTVNRLGHTTTFTYSGVKLSTVTLAPAGANKVYTFAYPSSTQMTITAPAIDASTPRVTTFTLSSGRITQITDPDTSVVSFSYSSTYGSYRVTSRVNRRGVSDSYHYDAARRVSSGGTNIPGTDPIVTLSNAETAGLAGTAAVDPAQVSTLINGTRADVTDTTRVWVNRYGAPQKIRNALGHVTQLFRRDPRWPGLVTQVIYPNGRNVAATYDVRGRVLTTTDSSTYLGSPAAYATATYQWDTGCDAVTQVVQPAGDKVGMGYDPVSCNRLWQAPGNLEARRVYFSYHDTWKLLTATLYPTPAGEPVSRDSIAYDPTTGNVTGTRTPRAYWATHFADGAGRDTLIASTVWETDYAAGVGSLGASKHWQRFRYDIMGRVTRSTTSGLNAAGNARDSVTVLTYYNREGQTDSLWRRSDPDSQAVGWIKTQWRYDELGRAINEIAPDGFTDSTYYDLAGNVTRYVSRRLLPTTMTYDKLNRLTQRTLPSILFPFQQTGTSEDTPLHQIWPTPLIASDVQIFEYDNMGNLIRADNADAKVSRTYNTNGTLASETQKIRTWADTTAGGNFTSHVYTLGFDYNRNGQRTKITHPSGLLPAGTIDGSTVYSYDPTTGEPSTVRDLYGRLYTYTYTPAGQLATLAYPGGLQEKYRYDRDGSLYTRIELNKPNHSGPYDWTPDTLRRDSLLARDARGKLLQMSGLAWRPETATFTYTGLGALTEAHTTWMFPGDPWGGVWQQRSHETYGANALASVEPFTTADTTFNPSGGVESSYKKSGAWYRYGAGTGRLLGEWWSCCGQVSHVVHDSSGNVVRQRGGTVQSPTSGGTWSYYGPDEKLRVVDVRGNDDYTWHYDDYRYDALGRRVLVRSRNSCGQYYSTPSPTSECVGKIRRTIWDGVQELWELQYRGGDFETATALEQDTGPATTTESRHYGRVLYTHGLGVDRPLQAMRLDYRHPSGPGTVVFDTLGITPHYSWRGFPDFPSYPDGSGARCTSTTGPCVDLMWWAGHSSYERKLYDVPTAWFGTLLQQKREATGLAYRRNRYYDPGTGRFTQEDPIGLAGGLNLYGYGAGDPIQYSDPFGLNPCILEIDGACRDSDVTLAALDVVLGAGTRTANALGSAVSWLRKGGQAARTIEGIYEFVTVRGKKYIGQSKDVLKRLRQHVRSGKVSSEQAERAVITEVRGGKTAREVAEQRRIDALGGIRGGALENERNPLGEARQHLLDEFDD